MLFGLWGLSLALWKSRSWSGLGRFQTKIQQKLRTWWRRTGIKFSKFRGFLFQFFLMVFSIYFLKNNTLVYRIILQLILLFLGKSYSIGFQFCVFTYWIANNSAAGRTKKLPSYILFVTSIHQFIFTNPRIFFWRNLVLCLF